MQCGIEIEDFRGIGDQYLKFRLISTASLQPQGRKVLISAAFLIDYIHKAVTSPLNWLQPCAADDS